MRAWAKRNDKKAFKIDESCSPFNPNCSNPLQYTAVDTYQYSYVGPLSMQKGCDCAFHMYTKSTESARPKKQQPNNGIGYETNKLNYRGM